jgi:hypothetical protein
MRAAPGSLGGKGGMRDTAVAALASALWLVPDGQGLLEQDTAVRATAQEAARMRNKVRMEESYEVLTKVTKETDE